jgi:SHS2 domain-containing protein
MEERKNDLNCGTAKPQQCRSGFKYLDHPSDIAIEVCGNTVRELFLNAALGMLSIISDVKSSRERKAKRFDLSEESYEELLHSFLSEILWLVMNERFFPLRIHLLSFAEYTLDANIEGIRLKDTEIKSEVKAVTYHQLEIVKKKDIWCTNVIFDV